MLGAVGVIDNSEQRNALRSLRLICSQLYTLLYSNFGQNSRIFIICRHFIRGNAKNQWLGLRRSKIHSVHKAYRQQNPFFLWQRSLSVQV